MMSQCKFILTNDLTTKENLLKMGFSMVKSSGDVYIFQNANYSKVYEAIQNFELDKSKLTFTNKLYF
jgi:hypothetical protein